ncbi:MAG: 7-carboxy-7-deazaguanine synthase [Acidobacteria bacterium]|nr:7-carboxy-7-deazaguanine synthase [Acidobacteriota bacterium]
MSYRLCEIFYSIQGEGIHAGRPAVFCRFAGCNLDCVFCDTDWVNIDRPGGGEYAAADQLVAAVTACWPSESRSSCKPMVVCTGGEPLLQLDAALIAGLHREGYQVALETNGTLLPPAEIDWVCVSPKSLTSLVATTGDELKLLYPLPEIAPTDVEHLDFRHFCLQPIDGQDLKRNTHRAIEYCLRHPKWRLSIQVHKLIGVQ